MIKNWFNPKYWLLKRSELWYVEKEWLSQEWLYYHKGRKQLLKHRIYGKYNIISNFVHEPYDIKEAVKLFMFDFKKNKLLHKKTSIIYNNSKTISHAKSKNNNYAENI